MHVGIAKLRKTSLRPVYCRRYQAGFQASWRHLNASRAVRCNLIILTIHSAGLDRQETPPIIRCFAVLLQQGAQSQAGRSILPSDGHRCRIAHQHRHRRRHQPATATRHTFAALHPPAQKTCVKAVRPCCCRHDQRGGICCRRSAAGGTLGALPARGAALALAALPPALCGRCGKLCRQGSLENDAHCRLPAAERDN